MKNQKNIKKQNITVYFYLALLVLPLLVYWQTTKFDFVWDDRPLHINEKNFPQSEPSGNFSEIWTPKNNTMYAPVAYTFWGIANIIGGKTDDAGQPYNPFVFHLFNIIFHCLNGLLIFMILRKIIKNDRAAFAGALLFALHPIQSESVAWISELRGLLSGFFGFLSLLLFLVFRERSKAQKFNYFYFLSILSFAVSMLAKPSGIVFPFIIILIDYFINKKSLKEIGKALAPWLIFLVPIMILTWYAQSHTSIKFQAPVAYRPFIFFDTIGFYLLKIIFPLNISADYGRTPDFLINDTWLYISWLVPLAIGFVLWFYRKTTRDFLFSFLVFLIGYLPLWGFVSFYFQYWSTVADRYLYVSMLGVSAAFAYIFLKFKTSSQAIIFTVVIVILMIIINITHLSVWKNDFSLWNSAIKENPDRTPHAYSGRGVYYMEHKQYNEALADFNSAINLYPGDATYYYNLGSVELDMNDFNKSIEDFSKALSLNPNYTDAYYNRGIAWSSLNNDEKAIIDYTKALNINPNQPDVYANRGTAYARLGKLQLAIEDFRKAVELNPNDIDAAQNLRRAEMELSQPVKQQP